MWISQATFTSLVADRAKAEGEARALETHNVALKTTMDWMAMRLTQLEHERAQLIFNYMGVKIQVPSIEPAGEPVTTSDILSAAPSFADMGDEAAKAEGYDWDAEGRLTQHGKLVQS